MKKVNIFICSKPLQYLNICNIPVTDSNKKILVICDAFNKALDFTDNIRKYEKQWDEVILAHRRSWVFTVLRYRVDKLFWGLDTTLVGVLHFIKRFKFYLYEEGAGMYRHLEIRDKFKLLTRIIGTGKFMGTSTYLYEIFVYYPDFYISQINPTCQVSSFNLPYRQMIKQNIDKFLKLYGFNINEEPFLNIKNSKILLYLTDWEYQESTIEKMKQMRSNYDYLFIKPHPHIRQESIPDIKGIDILNTTLVVEIIIHIWLDNNNSITVFHQNSTAITPFGNEINSINVNELSKFKNTKSTINVSESSENEYREIIEKLTILSMKKDKNQTCFL